MIELEPGEARSVHDRTVRFRRVNWDGSGAYFLTWSARDYCTFFAHRKGWPPDVTMRQPVGALDQIADDIIQAERRAEPKDRESVFDTMKTIAGR